MKKYVQNWGKVPKTESESVQTWPKVVKSVYKLLRVRTIIIDDADMNKYSQILPKLGKYGQLKRYINVNNAKYSQIMAYIVKSEQIWLNKNNSTKHFQTIAIWNMLPNITQNGQKVN